MTREKEIKNKAKHYGQMLFPDECNIWARPNYEAQSVEKVCTEIAKWADETMINKACEWWKENSHLAVYADTREKRNLFIDVFRKAMEE